MLSTKQDKINHTIIASNTKDMSHQIMKCIKQSLPHLGHILSRHCAVFCLDKLVIHIHQQLSLSSGIILQTCAWWEARGCTMKKQGEAQWNSNCRSPPASSFRPAHDEKQEDARWRSKKEHNEKAWRCDEDHTHTSTLQYLKKDTRICRPVPFLLLHEHELNRSVHWIWIQLCWFQR